MILFSALIAVVIVYISIANGLLKTQEPVVKGVHESPGFESELFYRSLAQERNENIVQGHHIKGMVIPHHYIAGSMMADMFHRLSQQKPETIIIIGPNHYEAGNHLMVTSNYGWNTHRGVVFPNSGIITDMVQKKEAFVDESVMANEHSTGGMMPFIKQFNSSAKVVPIIMKRGMSLEKISNLAASIAAYAKKKGTVVIASVDFSHYLPTREAGEKDQITLDLMHARDYKKIITLNNDYMDSPPALITLFKVMDEIGTNNLEVIEHKNSGTLIQDEYGETTSYFTIAFFQNK